MQHYFLRLFLLFFQGDFISMGVYSSGNSYGVPDDLIYSFPVQIKVRLTHAHVHFYGSLQYVLWFYKTCAISSENFLVNFVRSRYKIENSYKSNVFTGQDLEDCRGSDRQQLFSVKDGRHSSRADRGERHSCGFPGSMTRPLKITQPELRQPHNSKLSPVMKHSTNPSILYICVSVCVYERERAWVSVWVWSWIHTCVLGGCSVEMSLRT